MLINDYMAILNSFLHMYVNRITSRLQSIECNRTSSSINVNQSTVVHALCSAIRSALSSHFRTNFASEML